MRVRSKLISESSENAKIAQIRLKTSVFLEKLLSLGKNVIRFSAMKTADTYKCHMVTIENDFENML